MDLARGTRPGGAARSSSERQAGVTSTSRKIAARSSRSLEASSHRPLVERADRMAGGRGKRRRRGRGRSAAPRPRGRRRVRVSDRPPLQRSAVRLRRACASGSSTSTRCRGPGRERRRGAAAAATRSSRSSSPTGSGIDYVWEVEHHFLEEYSHSCAPEVFLAAAQPAHQAASGSATASCSSRPAFNHPARVAERIATLDLVSGGRVEFGTGESSSAGRAGRLRRRPRDASASSGRRRSTRSPACSSRSRSPATTASGCRCRRATCVPKPKQKPHPPLWVACSRRETILLAAAQGHRRADVRVHRARGGAGVGRRVLRADRSPTSACRPASR